MIARSLAAFIGAQTDLTDLGLAQVVAHTPDDALSELTAPCCVVKPYHEGSQQLWELGDAHRQEMPVFLVSFYAQSDELARQLGIRFRRLIESATAMDTGSLTHPGINFLAVADRLIDSGDHKTYNSNQTSWFSTPTPIVYKNEDAYGQPAVTSATGYTINSSTGQVTFSSANAAADKIRATYKVGVIDFNIAGVVQADTAQETDIANVPARYVVAVALEAFYYVKTNANRHL